MPDRNTTLNNYVVHSSFFVLIVFILSLALTLVYLLQLWYVIGLEIIFGAGSPAEKGLTTYIPTLIYLAFAITISIIIGLLSVIYFRKVTIYLYSIALDKNARGCKLKKRWFRGITLSCIAVALSTHIVVGGSIISYIDSLISTSNPRHYGRNLLIGLGGVWLFVSFLVEITIITALRIAGIESVEEVDGDD